MKQNYIDENGVYHNNLNLSLTQIFDSGAKYGYNSAKENYEKGVANGYRMALQDLGIIKREGEKDDA